ncbi:Uma2 family endonuclease [Thermoflexus sp.]|uniref:Uma2 family endonuclease n=1 Tax=Thermoflexus sp. TaxID=1969742 RepID=UPI0035E45A55
MARAAAQPVRLESHEAFRRWAEDQPGYWIPMRGIPMDAKLGEDTVYPPDLRVVLVGACRSAAGDPCGFAVNGPSRSSGEALQLRAGVPESWVVDPETRTVEVYGLERDRLVLIEGARGEGRVRSRRIPGLEGDITALFRDL